MSQRELSVHRLILVLVVVAGFCLQAATGTAAETAWAPLPGYAPGVPEGPHAGRHAFWVNDRKKPVQGELTRQSYSLDPSAAPLSSSKIIAHYAADIKSKGGEILYENPRNFLHGRYRSDEGEYWVEVLAETNGEGFTMTTVQVAAASDETTGASAKAVRRAPARPGSRPSDIAGSEINPSLLPCARAGGQLPFNVSVAAQTSGAVLLGLRRPDTSVLQLFQARVQPPREALHAFSPQEPNCIR